MTSRCDVTCGILTSAKNQDIQGIFLLLVQNYEEGFLVRLAGRLHRRSVGIDVFPTSKGSHTQNLELCVELDVDNTCIDR